MVGPLSKISLCFVGASPFAPRNEELDLHESFSPPTGDATAKKCKLGEYQGQRWKIPHSHAAAGEDVNSGGNAVFRYLPYLPQEKKNLMKSNFSSRCHLQVTTLVKA